MKKTKSQILLLELYFLIEIVLILWSEVYLKHCFKFSSQKLRWKKMSALLSTLTGYMNSADHSQLRLDFKICFLVFCQRMLLIPVL
jgi:hypothetical protein